MEFTFNSIFILVFFVGVSFSEKKTPKPFGYLLVEQGITSSFGTAGEALSWNANGHSNIQKAPLFIIRSGIFYAGSFDGQASNGYLWSGATYSGTDAYYLDYNSSNVRPAGSYYRQNGFPVRCIAKHFYYGFLKAGPKVI